MNLSRLMQRMAVSQAVEAMGLTGGAEIDIRGIHYRAQAVEPGGMFFAVPGQHSDGHAYIDTALGRGAAAVVTERPVSVAVPCLVVKDARKALSGASAEFFNNPSADLILVGVTGTNGKTTTAFLVESILKQAGCSTGLMGTICCRYAGRSMDSAMTTPESLDIQRLLAEMRASGVTHGVLEVSSHALALSRVEDCWLDVGVFTNFSRDHLDFHQDMEHYWKTKRRLFTELLQQGPKKERARCVFNGNDPKGRELIRRFPQSGVGVGFDPSFPIWAEMKASLLSGIHAVIHTPKGTFSVRSSLAGRHNLENLLCAAGVGFLLGFSLETIQKGLEAVQRVPGRFETIPDAAGRTVIVDYAHTPDALENVLNAVRALNPGRIITVFGCGGDRDRGKRPRMGEIAGRLSDWVFVTSDNPRKEDPHAILAAIRQGLLQVGVEERDPETDPADGRKAFSIIPDRRTAIRSGIRSARPGDVVVIAGKGHETYQIHGDRTLHFDDREEAEAVLAESVPEGRHA